MVLALLQTQRRNVPVTTTETRPAAPQKTTCVACGRQYGRLRSPRGEPDSTQTALIDCAELMVCDQCWHLAGNTREITARLADPSTETALVFDPTVETLLVAANDYDQLHPLDRLLVESGVRWAVLRHIAVPARMQLAVWVAQRPAPPATRAADSPEAWLNEVETRIRAQSSASHTSGGPADRAGEAEFVYNAKRRRWWRICHVLRCCADRDKRPLTWVTQDEIAATIGCSTRTVRRCVAWLRAEGLLWEVVPGCRLPQQSRPDNESSAEAGQRRIRMINAIAAEEAAMARARAELDVARTRSDDEAIPAAERRGSGPPEMLMRATCPVEDVSEPEPCLVNIAPVYELRVPQPAPDNPSDLNLNDRSDSLTSENTSSTQGFPENVHPPEVSNKDHLKSKYVQPVDKRRAPRGPDPEQLAKPHQHRCAQTENTGDGPQLAAPSQPPSHEGQPAPTRQSEAVRAAQWLLRSRLDPRICDHVSVRWLASQIRGGHLLDRHDWSWEDLADQLHGYPEHAHLPYHVRDSRAWIRARIRQANPHLSPTKLRVVLDIERGSDLLRRRRREHLEAERQAEITARRDAINACPLCDEIGWLHVHRSVPTARCNHDLESGGW